MSGALEVELKLRAASPDVLEQLAGTAGVGSATLGAAETFAETDIYLDTVDRRLGALRWACRLRERHGERWASLKGPAEHAPGDAYHRRPELEGPVSAGLRPTSWPPSPARDLLLRLAGDAQLHEVLTLRQRRSERAVHVDARHAGTLTLDVVTVVHDGRTVGEVHEVELELVEGADTGPTHELATWLLQHPGLRPESASKLEMALAMIGSEDEAAP